MATYAEQLAAVNAKNASEMATNQGFTNLQVAGGGAKTQTFAVTCYI